MTKINSKKTEILPITIPLIRQRPIGKKKKKINYHAMFTLILEKVKPWLSTLQPPLTDYDAVRMMQFEINKKTIYIKYHIDREFKLAYLPK